MPVFRCSRGVGWNAGTERRRSAGSPPSVKATSRPSPWLSHFCQMRLSALAASVGVLAKRQNKATVGKLSDARCLRCGVCIFSEVIPGSHPRTCGWCSGTRRTAVRRHGRHLSGDMADALLIGQVMLHPRARDSRTRAPAGEKRAATPPPPRGRRRDRRPS
jgi:hypothetical protein